ncbi:hypothetical protein K458DRAFT_391131 [Lentithecium fluviatile CBS 122367]|uniref:Cupin type-1 domain-containing protein n=1 Tax=Lentithecium fluviatile CBS 122367 TaxID=1168545 RepID=A0A6G1IV20_9PLEO|nr:hypothetical protein K458DRAFT_391131 [Lentithecium fluviatile CBS 122367]
MADAPTDNTELIAKLKTDATAIKRFQRLLTDGGQLLSGTKLTERIIFDFNKEVSSIPGGKGGTTRISNIESFPILIGSGISMTRASLGPCGVVIPHVHPRATEYFLLVDGEVDFGYMLELGLLGPAVPNPVIEGKLNANQGTVFPQGSIHFQINNSPDCKPANIMVTLGSEDPGTTPIVQMPSGGNATATDPDDVRAILPPQLASVVTTCLARCYPDKA